MASWSPASTRRRFVLGRLDLGQQGRDGRTQLMRRIGHEMALAGERGIEAHQQTVDLGDHRLDFQAVAQRLPLVDGAQALGLFLQAHRDDLPAVPRNILLGFLCGGGFLVVKVIEYAAKFGAGITMSTNTFYMFYISLTFFHFMHVILGMVILAVIWVQARKGAYTSQDAHGLESGAAYWHMVDLLWIILFPLVYVMR